MTGREVLKYLDNLHSKIVRSSFAENVTESEIIALVKYKNMIKEIQQYRSIGAVEECRDAIKKQKPKKYKEKNPCKSLTYYKCHVCDGLLHINESYCGNCGQAISWEESENGN